MRFLTIFAVCLTGANTRAETPVTIFAAASLRGPLERVFAEAGIDSRTSYGGSGTLARQVAQGAPADVLILASPVWSDWLATQIGTGVTWVPALLSNRLVLVGPPDMAALAGPPDINQMQDRLDGGRLAMGQRDAVPAGIYASAWLKARGLWEGIEVQLAETANVRMALALVARGEAPLGLVYATDAQASDRVAVLWTPDPALYPDVEYPALALSEAGAAVLETLQSPEAMAIFRAAGFGTALDHAK